MVKLCSVCGDPLKGIIEMGGVTVCRRCEPALSAEIAATRASGNPVNVAHIAHRMYKETYSGGNYLLRDVPEGLLQRAKHRAVDEGNSLRVVILKALYDYCG